MRLRTPADFGAVIRDRRRKLGLSQQELARRVGAGREWMVALEKGKAGARLSLVLRTLDLLGISLIVDQPSGAGKRTAKKAAGTRRAINRLGDRPVDIDRILDNLRKKRP